MAHFVLGRIIVVWILLVYLDYIFAFRLYQDQGFYVGDLESSILHISSSDCRHLSRDTSDILISEICVYSDSIRYCSKLSHAANLSHLAEFITVPGLRSGHYELYVHLLDLSKDLAYSYSTLVEIVDSPLTSSIVETIHSDSWPNIWLELSIIGSDSFCFVVPFKGAYDELQPGGGNLQIYQDIFQWASFRKHLLYNNVVQMRMSWVGSGAYWNQNEIHRGVDLISRLSSQRTVTINGLSFPLLLHAVTIDQTSTTSLSFTGMENIISFPSDLFSYFIECSNEFRLSGSLTNPIHLDITTVRFIEVLPSSTVLDSCHFMLTDIDANYTLISTKNSNEIYGVNYEIDHSGNIGKDSKVEVVECLRRFSQVWKSQHMSNDILDFIRYRLYFSSKNEIAKIKQSIAVDIISGEGLIPRRQHICFYFSGKATGQTLKMTRIARMLSLFPEKYMVSFFVCKPNNFNSGMGQTTEYNAISDILQNINGLRGFDAISILSCLFAYEFDFQNIAQFRINTTTISIDLNESKKFEDSEKLFSFLHFLISRMKPELFQVGTSLQSWIESNEYNAFLQSISIVSLRELVWEYAVLVLYLYDYQVSVIEPVWVKQLWIEIMDSIQQQVSQSCDVMIIGNARSAMDAVLLEASHLLGAHT